jgi:ABC-type transport system involved in multi-copper enzyme maturation permease subunit
MRGAVAAIAWNTFREAIRDRVLYLLLAFAILVVGTSRFLSLLTVGSEEKIIKDVGLAAILLFGVLLAVFVGVSLVFKEIEKRTVLTLLANPVRRWQFVVGKYLGLLLVLGANTVLMTAVLFGVLLARGDRPWPLLAAVLTIAVQLSVLAAFAILFSSYTNSILSAVGTVAVYVAGHLSWSLDLLRNRVDSVAAKTACDVVHLLLPNLDRLNLHAAAVHGLPLPQGTLLWGVAYGLAYAAVIVVIACLVFERREFA